LSEFIIETQGPPGIFGVFEDEGETGYLYVYEPDGRGIFGHLQIYVRSDRIQPNESDVSVLWSSDQKKCGVIIWGGMRGIIDLKNDRQVVSPLEDRNSAPIIDEEWMRGFDAV
jgi:hypothetical protein